MSSFNFRSYDYSCVRLALGGDEFWQVQSWRKWEIQAQQAAGGVNLEGNLVLLRQSCRNFEKSDSARI